MINSNDSFDETRQIRHKKGNDFGVQTPPCILEVFLGQDFQQAFGNAPSAVSDRFFQAGSLQSKNRFS
ncbi:MAG: hypothetical protein A2511_17345 [Deltaproteobacteria bacterium RIFOXYD12_FULL_50_9]|nr:MAG: hypothetical protein A2511_17345 [Deltaproteobacteria bacterium RIFOXYD12_FULL_50_9]